MFLDPPKQAARNSALLSIFIFFTKKKTVLWVMMTSFGDIMASVHYLVYG